MCIKSLYKYSRIFMSYVSNIAHVCVLLFMGQKFTDFITFGYLTCKNFQP